MPAKSTDKGMRRGNSAERCYFCRALTAIARAHCFTIDSMRRSGTNHMSAIATYSTTAIHGLTKASGIATTYMDGYNLPFRFAA